MIQAEPDPQKRDEYLQRLMELPNQARSMLHRFSKMEMLIMVLLYNYVCLYGAMFSSKEFKLDT